MLISLVVIGVLLLALGGYASTRPDSFGLERGTLIEAAPERVFGLINDLHGFNTWNPWAEKDPLMKTAYEGPDAGVGAAHSWQSDKVGSGRMEIVESVPSSQVAMKLDFIKPFEAHNTSAFTLAPHAGGTRVVWSMRGPVPFLGKLMHLFVNMDKLVGRDFEKGLANLKRIAEQA